MIQFHCLKCNARKHIPELLTTHVVTEKGRHMRKAQCPTCGRRLSAFVKRN